MQKVFITFLSILEALPGEFSNESEIPLGHLVTCQIQDMCRRTGINCSDIEQWNDYGWVFYAEIEGLQISCMLQASDNWLLIVDYDQSIFDRLFGKSKVRKQVTFVAEHIRELLARDNRFNTVRYFSNEQNFRKDLSQ